MIDVEKYSTTLEVADDQRDTVMWLGAGFSRSVSKGRLPLLKGFFEGLQPDRYPHLHRYLSCRCSGLETANVEAILLSVEQMEDSPLPPRLRHSILGGQNPMLIRNELERFCIDRLTFEEIEIDHWPVQLLAHANERTTVITTNYDTIAEQILSDRAAATHCGPSATCHHCNMRSILAEDCECDWTRAPRIVGAGNAALLKLHGSIAWHTCSNSACRINDCLIASCDCSPSNLPTCKCCGEGSRPVIVLPPMRKSFRLFPQLSRMWERSHLALSRCTTLTVFGFSFPQSDCLICEVMRDALKVAKHLRDVIVIDVNPEAVGQRVEELLPLKTEVPIVLCKAPEDYSHPSWFGLSAAA